MYSVPNLWWLVYLGLAVTIIIIILVIGTSYITRSKLTKLNSEKILSLKFSEKKYRSLIETIEDGILVVDKDLKILFANSKFQQKWNHNSTDLFCTDLNYIIGSKKVKLNILSVLKNEKSNKFDFNSKIGDESNWFDTILSPQYDESDKIVSVLCVFRDITKRKEMENQLVNLIDTLKDQQKSLSRLSKELIKVQEDERKRISHDLHDVIGQRLTAVSLNLEAVKSGAFTKKELNKKILDSSELVQNTIKQVQDFSFSLRPTILDDLGLIPAIQIYAKNYSGRTGIKVDIKEEQYLEGLDSNIKIVLYRIFQEGLTNVAKHANAKNVYIFFSVEADHIKMYIVDDGTGIDSTKKKNRGLGLLGMSERLAMIGGSIDFVSANGDGTKLIVKTPYEINE